MDANAHLRARLDDWLSCSGVRFSGFLTQSEAAYCRNALGAAVDRCTFWGGHPDAQRVTLGISPDAPPPYDGFPLCALTLTWSHASAPSHRAVMGSILALGIARDKLGDIAVGENAAVLFCAETVATLILGELDRCRATPVRVTRGLEIGRAHV